MTNINFDRPYLLFLIIPLLILVFVPFFLAIRRENKTKGTIVSLILHVIMSVLVTFVAAGTSITTVITETSVWVVADVSHSTTKNLDLIDEYIDEVEKKLPSGAKLGVVAFGKDQKIVTELGEKFDTVRGSSVDDSGTDIKSALSYAGGLFREDVVKRIVLITDAKQTSGTGLDGIVSTVDDLYKSGVYIDAIYLDDNLNENDKEVQVTTVDVTPTTYLNHKALASVLIQSSSTERINAKILLHKGDEEISSKHITLTQGFNVENLPLPTDTAGTFDYRITVEPYSTTGSVDISDKNNYCDFTQEVSSNINVLLLTEKGDDLERAIALYGENAKITAYVNDTTFLVTNDMTSTERRETKAKADAYKQKFAAYENVTLLLNDVTVPDTIEKLVVYDEFVFSDVDIRNLQNFKSMITSVATLVSDYGKSLMTFGNTYIQNQSDDVLKSYEDMLPTNFGNKDQDAKLLCLVIDTSRSMENYSKLIMARAAAKQLVDLLGPNDSVMIINFWGDYTTKLPSTPVSGNKELIYDAIDTMEAQQGTLLAKGMKEAYEKLLKSSIDDKQVFLISDGRSWANEDDDAVGTTKDLFDLGIPTSVLNTCTEVVIGDEEASGVALKLLQDIAYEGCGRVGPGNYYFVKDEEDLIPLILSEVIDDLSDTVIEKAGTEVNVKLGDDDVLEGIDTDEKTPLPTINGFIYSKAKASAITVLSANYKKTSGAIKEAPIYVYWNYGRGRVACFTSTLSGAWTENYTSGSGLIFSKNIFTTNAPEQKRSAPFTTLTEVDGGTRVVTLTPATLNFDGTAAIEVITPDGEIIKELMIFNSQNYTSSFTASKPGKYTVKFTYNYAGTAHTETQYLTVPYEAEYDSFTAFTISDLYKIIRNCGTVNKNADINIENDEDDISTYTLYFAVPFMTLAVILFVIDIMFRKLRWADIRNLFGLKDKRLKGGTGK